MKTINIDLSSLPLTSGNHNLFLQATAPTKQSSLLSGQIDRTQSVSTVNLYWFRVVYDNVYKYFNYQLGKWYEVTQEKWVASQIKIGDNIPTPPELRWFRPVNGWEQSENIFTAVYTYNVGKGDLNGDGVISFTDYNLIKRQNVGLDRAKRIMDAAAAWEKTNDNSVTDFVLYTACDVNNSGKFNSSDVVALREALATGSTYYAINDPSVTNICGETVRKASRKEVTTIQELTQYLSQGYPIQLQNDLVTNDDLNIIGIGVNIDFNGHTISCNNFSIQASCSVVLFSGISTRGKIISVNDISKNITTNIGGDVSVKIDVINEILTNTL